MPLAGPRPPFEPGQFNMLYAFGVGEVRDQHERRPVTNSCLRAYRPRCRRRQRRDRKTRIGGDRSACAVRSAPAGRSSEAEGSDIVIVAGGLGLAPLRPAIYDDPGQPRRAMAGWSFCSAAATPMTCSIATRSSNGAGASTSRSK